MTNKRIPPAAWKPGESGNPRGKPKGAINKTTRLALELFEGGIKNIAEVVIKQAKDGDLTAARLVLDKLVPNARERAVELPGLPSTESPAGVADAQAAILQAVAAGDLTPGEAATLSGIVENRRKAIETQELELRIQALEDRP
ncbi:DUF5681 domain-containing protein [Zoogloea sp.]|uniref:DUF5681 domain-containing protein n=1 Tax=Zoogloea sp. TaxID=49181 RepID=UPI001AC48BEA|nr:DUF5681 domain-containing protein [Zoogloea sp.]MBN8283751.1 hypothetical protein [Zoogloea sp.]